MIKNDELDLSVPKAIWEASKTRTSQDVFGDLTKEISKFEAELKTSDDVAIQAVSLQGALLINQVSYRKPDLLIFSGTTLDGATCRLIQHVSQLNFCLIGMPRQNPELPRRKIGFAVLDAEDK